MQPRIYEYFFNDELHYRGTVRYLSNVLNRSTKAIRNLHDKTLKGTEDLEAVEFTGEYYYPEFAYYKGDDMEMIGTISEIAEYSGLTYETVRWYSTPSANRGKTKLERVDDEEGEAIV